MNFCVEEKRNQMQHTLEGIHYQQRQETDRSHGFADPPCFGHNAWPLAWNLIFEASNKAFLWLSPLQALTVPPPLANPIPTAAVAHCT